jgi:hypothetical protein
LIDFSEEHIASIIMVEAQEKQATARSKVISETSAIFYQSTRRRIPDDSILLFTVIAVRTSDPKILHM